MYVKCVKTMTEFKSLPLQDLRLRSSQGYGAVGRGKSEVRFNPQHCILQSSMPKWQHIF